MATKLNQRAEKALLPYRQSWSNGTKGTEPPALLVALVAYASQNPGLDFANYGSMPGYRGDSRMISRQWHDVVESVRCALYAGVTDAHIREACRSDRLSIDDSGRIDYTTGQYWPTEYRGAVARVLNYACRIAGIPHAFY